jgi:hypothetical protein
MAMSTRGIDKQGNYPDLLNQVGELLRLGREQAGRAVNTILVQTYWEIGRHIVEFEQGGDAKAGYGTDLLNRLANDLTLAYGKGFGRSNLFYMRKLFLAFQNRGTLSHYLSWGHYYEILKADNELEVSFYVKQCELEKWTLFHGENSCGGGIQYLIGKKPHVQSIFNENSHMEC